MPSKTIQTIRPNVARDEACAMLGGGDPGTMFWRMRNGHLRTVADAYVPHTLFEVQMRGRSESLTHFYALDSVEGSLDPYEFPAIPAADALVRVETRNCLEVLLPEEKVQSRLREKVLRMIFERGFFKTGASDLRLQAVPLQFYMPYWLGFYGRENKLRCRVIDAVRRRIEGAKARAFFETWLSTS